MTIRIEKVKNGYTVTVTAYGDGEDEFYPNSDKIFIAKNIKEVLDIVKQNG